MLKVVQLHTTQKLDSNQEDTENLKKTLSDLVKESQVTSEKDLLIKALEVKLKKIENLYKKSLDKQLDIRTKYEKTVQNLAVHKLISNKLYEENEMLKRIPKARGTFLKQQNELKLKMTKWKEKYDQLATSLEHKESNTDPRKLDNLFEMIRSLETQLSEQTEQFDTIDAQIPKDVNAPFATISLKSIQAPPKLLHSQQVVEEDLPNDESDEEDILTFTIDVARFDKIKKDLDDDITELTKMSLSRDTEQHFAKKPKDKSLEAIEVEQQKEEKTKPDTDLKDEPVHEESDPIRFRLLTAHSPANNDTVLKQLHPKEELQTNLISKTDTLKNSSKNSAMPEMIFRSGKLGPVSTSQKRKIPDNPPDKLKVASKDTGTDDKMLSKSDILSRTSEVNLDERVPPILSVLDPLDSPKLSIVKDRKRPPPAALKITQAGLKKIIDIQKQKINNLKGEMVEKCQQIGSVLEEAEKHENHSLDILRQCENGVYERANRCNNASEKLKGAEDNRRALQKRLKELQDQRPKDLSREARGSPKKNSEIETVVKSSKSDEDNAIILGVLADKNKDLKKKLKERDLPIQSQQNEIDDLESKRKKTDRRKSYEDRSTKSTCVCDELEFGLRPNEENWDKERNDRERKAIMDSNEKLQDQLNLSTQRQQKLRSDINSMRSKCEDEKDRLIAENADAMKQLISNRNEFEETQKKIQKDLDALRLDNERLKAELQHVKADLNAKETKATEELQKCKLDNANLQNKLRMSTEALKDFKEDLKEIGNLRVKNSKLKTEMDTLDKKLTDLAENEYKIDELKAANEDLRNQIRALEQKLEGETPDDSFMRFITPEEMTRYFSTKAAPLTFSDELFNSYKDYSWENRQSDILTKSYDKDRYLSGRVSSLSVLEDVSDRDNRPSVDKRSTKPQVRIKETSTTSATHPLSNQVPRDEKEPVKINTKIELLYDSSSNTSNELDKIYPKRLPILCLPKENKDERMIYPVKNKNPRCTRPSKAASSTRHSNATKRACLGAQRQISQNSSSKCCKVPVNSSLPDSAKKLQRTLKTSSRTYTKCPHGHRIYY